MYDTGYKSNFNWSLVDRNNLSLSQMLDTMTNSQVSRPLRCYLSSRMFCSVVLPALIAFNAVGCGEPESKIARKAIYGKILGGKGKDGKMRFIPIDTSIGPVAVNDVKDGAYRFTTKNGPVPGEYNVTIELEAPASSARPPGRGERRRPNAAGRAVFDEPKRTTASVSADGPLEIDLDVTK